MCTFCVYVRVSSVFSLSLPSLSLSLFFILGHKRYSFYFMVRVFSDEVAMLSFVLALLIGSLLLRLPRKFVIICFAVAVAIVVYLAATVKSGCSVFVSVWICMLVYATVWLCDCCLDVMWRLSGHRYTLCTSRNTYETITVNWIDNRMTKRASASVSVFFLCAIVNLYYDTTHAIITYRKDQNWRICAAKIVNAKSNSKNETELESRVNSVRKCEMASRKHVRTNST